MTKYLESDNLRKNFGNLQPFTNSGEADVRDIREELWKEMEIYISNKYQESMSERVNQ